MPANGTNAGTFWHDRPPRNGPELMPLDNQLFNTLCDMVKLHAAATYSAANGADGKYPTATPKTLFSAIGRCWGAVPEKRIFDDIDLWVKNIKRVIELKGAALPEVRRTGHRAYPTVAVRGLPSEDAKGFFDAVREQIRSGFTNPKQNLS